MLTDAISPQTSSQAASRAIDELAISPREISDVYEKIESLLAAAVRERANAKALRLMRELGVTFNLYAEERATDHFVPFDVFPRIIDAAEWEKIIRGLAQRLAIWNAFFRDIYDSQEVLKAGIVPFEIIYSDPNYLRAAVGVKVPSDIYAHVAGFDLARDQNGRWIVIDDYVSRTTGASYSLQARSVLSQTSPELFDLADVSPIHGFASELLERLRSYAQAGAAEPRVVALTSGEYTHDYYEDSYLARQMGIPLVRGNDLIVLNARVYYKTIGGLEPIDVLYRRTSDSGIDPLALARGDFYGVPGLMTCVRKGTVTVANAIGAGLGDNRAIAAYLPKLARFYLNEPLQIPAVSRLLCFDPDQCEMVLENPREFFITTVTTRPGQKVWRTVDLNDQEIEKLRGEILKNPRSFVAEPYMPLDTLPSSNADLEPRHAGLRVFTLGGRALPANACALTRVASEPDSRVISTGLGGGIKDTWILRGRAGAAEQSEPVEIFIPSPHRRLRLGSRIAENLYWMGRYAERAENTTRILKTLQSLQVEAHQDERSWVPLWEALARATGHPTSFFKRAATQQQPRNVTFYILLDRENPSSVLSCIERCRANAQGTRESVAPEVWSAINRVHSLLIENAPSGAGAKKELSDAPVEKVLDLEDAVLNQLDAVSGSVQKHMLRDNGWQFWHIGVHLERALTVALVMRQVFLKRSSAEPARAQQQIDSNLDALLRMLASLYAYRSRFQTRPVFRNAATMLLQDSQVSHSLFYCLEKIDATLGSAFREGPDDAGLSPVRQSAKLKCEIQFLEMESFFEPDARGKTADFDKLLASIEAKLNELSTAISDHYLYHQAINILR